MEKRSSTICWKPTFGPTHRLILAKEFLGRFQKPISVLVPTFNKRVRRGSFHLARFGTRVHVSSYYIAQAGSVVCARTRSAWTSKASREKVTLGSGNDRPNSAITEARTPRGFGIRPGRPLLRLMLGRFFGIDGNVDLHEFAHSPSTTYLSLKQLFFNYCLSCNVTPFPRVLKFHQFHSIESLHLSKIPIKERPLL